MKKNVLASKRVAINVEKFATVKNTVNATAMKKNVLVKFNTKKHAVQLRKNALLVAKTSVNTNATAHATLLAHTNPEISVNLTAKKVKQKRLLSKRAVAPTTFVKEPVAKLAKK